jgi:phosphoribosylamine-glycine ligase
MASRHPLLWTNREGRQNGRLKDVFQGLYEQAQHSNSKVTGSTAICSIDRQNFSSYHEAAKYIDQISHNVVIKATGLAAGKGVIIPATKEESKTALHEILVDKIFGSAGMSVWFR